MRRVRLNCSLIYLFYLFQQHGGSIAHWALASSGATPPSSSTRMTPSILVHTDRPGPPTSPHFPVNNALSMGQDLLLLIGSRRDLPPDTGRWIPAGTWTVSTAVSESPNTPIVQLTLCPILTRLTLAYAIYRSPQSYDTKCIHRHQVGHTGRRSRSNIYLNCFSTWLPELGRHQRLASAAGIPFAG